jgi:DNA helicase-2/ATP-dependent DNA helicase PcrA
MTKNYLTNKLMPKSKTNFAFTKAYQALNKEQKKAVDTIDGPVMVVAGPGTGKTQTIALRMANILRQTDMNPDAVLALTFTESGARAMRTRLTEMIGVTAYYCHISTFHSFCIEVIKDNPDHFAIDPNAEPLSELEKLKLMYHLLDHSKLTALRPVGAPRHYVRAVLGAISDLKREGVDPTEFEGLLAKEETFLQSEEGSELKKAELSKRMRDLAKNRELLTLYEGYQAELKKSERFDFEDMINTVVNTFKTNAELLSSYQERFQYFLVDEYQDTNSAQNELFLLLASFWGDKANVFVTGDPDQSIMRFQGASIENQLSFIKVYPAATVITLKDNYRSTQTILDAADSLISHNNLRISDVVPGIDPHLRAHKSTPAKPIHLAQVSSGTAETILIAEDIKAKIKSGISQADIAVIYRTNHESSLIAATLVKYGIDYVVQGGANVLEDPTVHNFLKILRVIHEMRSKNDDENLFTILHYDIFGINALDVLKISRLASDRRLNLFEILADPSLLDSLSLTSRAKINTTLTSLGLWQSFEAEHTFSEFFEEVLNQSGYLKWVLAQPDAHHRLARLNTLFDEVKRMNRFDHSLDLSRFIENLDLMKENNLRLEESSFGVSRDAVTLTTAHSAKGLEWDAVYIYRCVDGTWGNNAVRNLLTLPDGVLKNVKLSDKEKYEDERRLFYVAMTRAKSTLTICLANSYSSFGATRGAAPSMFLSEMGDTNIEKLDVSKIETEAHSHIETLLTTTPEHSQVAEESAFLEELVNKFTLSVTALNTYLTCPYLFKLDKLLKVPHAKKPHLAFGTAVHRALELFYGQLKETGVKSSKEFLLDAFHTALNKEVITKKDLSVRLSQGDKILSAYFDFHQDDFVEPLFLEKFSRVQLDEITLTGKIDRIEWADQADRTVRVIDYKTGKGKTAGQIEGTTEDSSSDLKRQLVFYKLLIDLDKRLQNIHFGEAVLDFVQEPNDKWKDGVRRFQVKDEEVEELKKIIHSVMFDIKNLHFPRTTNYKTCVTCAFRDHCWPDGIPSSL